MRHWIASGLRSTATKTKFGYVDFWCCKGERKEERKIEVAEAPQKLFCTRRLDSHGVLSTSLDQLWMIFVMMLRFNNTPFPLDPAS